MIMWSVDQKDFLLLRDGGGQPFTGFVDALIRAHGFVYGVGEAEILTSLRTSIRDGGVDTQVRRAMPGEPTEFLYLRTCWQYKARPFADITDAALLKEIRKPYAAQLIREGYAYRVAICDDMPAKKQAAWEKLLTAAARKINPQAPEARVATASQLASWANSYPALLPAFFPHDPGPVQYFEAWTPNITKTTPTFVAVEKWQGKAESIEAHIKLTQPVRSPIITLQGMAGVGKTRLVYEIVAKLSGARNLVFYTADGEDAEIVSRFLANNRRTRGVLVADECPVLSRAAIMKILKGHAERVRVVCIDNSGERLGSDEELWLDQLSRATVEQVLDKNFQWVPVDRRRTYADESRGYIRLAAGLCEYDAEIQAKGHFGPALDVIREYYRERLPEERQQQMAWSRRYHSCKKWDSARALRRNWMRYATLPGKSGDRCSRSWRHSRTLPVLLLRRHVICTSHPKLSPGLHSQRLGGDGSSPTLRPGSGNFLRFYFRHFRLAWPEAPLRRCKP